MRVTIEAKELLAALESHNPGADFTAVKLYLFDLAIGAGESPAPAPKRELRPILPPLLPEKVRTTAPRQPSPKLSPIAAAVEVALDAANQIEFEGVGTVAEELSPFAPTTPLTGDTMEDDDGEDAPETTAQRLARQVMEPARASGPRKVVVESGQKTGPPVRRSPKDRMAEKQAKRKEMEDYSKLSGKELMEKLTATTLLEKKPGQNQFIDTGTDSGSGGDVELG